MRKHMWYVSLQCCLLQRASLGKPNHDFDAAWKCFRLFPQRSSRFLAALIDALASSARLVDGMPFMSSPW